MIRKTFAALLPVGAFHAPEQGTPGLFLLALAVVLVLRHRARRR